MRTWARTIHGGQCGNCRGAIAKGEEVELVELRGVKHPLLRCEQCALTPKPLQIPAGRTTKAMKPLRLALPAELFKYRDGKAKAAND